MKETTQSSGNERSNRDLTIKEIILKFVKYYECNGPYPQKDSELTDTEIEACRLIAASMIQLKDKNDFDKMINNLGGYDKFIVKMITLASESVASELISRIKSGMSLKNFDFNKMKLKFLSVSDTIDVLYEKKQPSENGNDR